MKQEPYYFLPFQFKPLGEKILLVNEVGEYQALTPHEWLRVVNRQVLPDENLFLDLSSKDFICLEYTAPRINRISAKYRTKKKYLFESTALHMFVITHRCNQSCAYCHASSVEHLHCSSQEDMSIQVAKKCVERAFESPSPYLKFEFQGGEPTLNFETVQAIIKYAEHINTFIQKRIEFVICTNLYDLKEQHLDFLSKHNVLISTSLDGPEFLHDSCRKTNAGKGTYKKVTRAIKHLHSTYPKKSVSALLTVTKHNIFSLQSVIDEYLSHGFSSIFIRQLNMFGMAQIRDKELCYSTEVFINAYINALDYIISLNKKGIFFVEEFAAILLSKILTPFSTGFVDMQSPAGTGIGAVIYEVDGNVFVSDEARMLHRATGSTMFRLGNVFDSNRNELFAAPILKTLMESSALECLPGCAWCAYLPYCGSDPIRNFSLYQKLISNKTKDPWCNFYRQVFDYLFQLLLSGDEELIDIFWGWTTGQKNGGNWQESL